MLIHVIIISTFIVRKLLKWKVKISTRKVCNKSPSISVFLSKISVSTWKNVKKTKQKYLFFIYENFDQ